MGYFEIIPGPTNLEHPSTQTLSEEFSPLVSNLFLPLSKALRHCAEQREVVLEVTITFRLLTATESLLCHISKSHEETGACIEPPPAHARTCTNVPCKPTYLGGLKLHSAPPLTNIITATVPQSGSAEIRLGFSFLFFTLFLNLVGLYCEGVIGAAVDQEGGEKVFIVAEHRGPVLGERRLTVGHIQSEALSCG